MKAGGVTVVSSYIFWIHHEEKEGGYDFTGNRDLRGFLHAVQDAGLPVFLRIGPWSVSYTHLDVYTRQLFGIRMIYLKFTVGQILFRVNRCLLKNGGIFGEERF